MRAPRPATASAGALRVNRSIVIDRTQRWASAAVLPTLLAVLLAHALACGDPSRGSRGGSFGSSHQGANQASQAPDLESALAAGDCLGAIAAASALESDGHTLSAAQVAGLERLIELAELADLPEQSRGGTAGSLIALRQALLAHHLDDERAVAMHMATVEPSDLLAPTIESVRARLVVPGQGESSKIAVLLPMSGPHQGTGEELWAGIQLSYKNAALAKNLRVKLYDTKGTEEGARQAAMQAAKDGSVVALGPAGRLESRAAALVAWSEGMPIALLAPEAASANAEHGVFRVALSPTFEAEQAALVAIELGYRLLAVMAPRDELGLQQSQAFARVARKAGAEIVVMGTYGPDAATLEQDFRDLLNLYPLTNERLRRHLRQYGAKSWKSFTPELGFDLLYLPDGLARGTLAASYLPFFNVELRSGEAMAVGRLQRKHEGLMPRIVQLVAPSSWLDPALSARGGDAVEGALILSTCPGGLGTDLSAQGAQFAEGFEAATGRAPSRAAALGYDAMSLILVAREEAAPRGGQRREFSTAMRTARLRDGLCGNLLMTASAQVEGQIEVLHVEAGHPEIYEY